MKIIVITIFSVLCLLFFLFFAETSNHQSHFVVSSLGKGIDTVTWWGSPQKHHIRESLGVGICWIDFDNDSDWDLFVPNGSRHFDPNDAGLPGNAQLQPWALYQNEGNRFEAVDLGLQASDWGVGCAVGDVNGDGFDDLLVTTASNANSLFINQQGKSFIDESASSGLTETGLSSSAAFGDLDGDGDLDLVIANYLDESKPPGDYCHWKGQRVMCGPKGFPMMQDSIYENDGSGHFTARSVLDQHLGYGLGVILIDVEKDRDLDIYIANDSNQNRLFVNHGNWSFTDMGFISGAGLSESGMTQAGMGVDAGDLDGDGFEDLIVTNFAEDSNNYYHNNKGESFSEWSAKSRLAQFSYKVLGWSVLLEDFDLDSDLDLFVVNGHVYPQSNLIEGIQGYRQNMQLFLNDGDGNFQQSNDILGEAGKMKIAGRGAATADFDQDGDMDIVVTREGFAPLLLENKFADQGRSWLKFILKGSKGNHRGLGAEIRVHTKNQIQSRTIRANRGYLSAGETSAIFGLGGLQEVLKVEIIWPDGSVNNIGALKVNQTIVVANIER